MKENVPVAVATPDSGSAARIAGSIGETVIPNPMATIIWKPAQVALLVRASSNESSTQPIARKAKAVNFRGLYSLVLVSIKPVKMPMVIIVAVYGSNLIPAPNELLPFTA